jgi:exosome complex component RRP41
MSRLEILNSGSLRLDGRLPLEIRSLALHISPEAPLLGISTLPGTSTQRPDGSARVQQGLTSVYATVYGPREAANRSNTLYDRASLDVNVNLEPWSGKDRRKRAKGDRYVEI